MQAGNAAGIQITHTTMEDLDTVRWLFAQALSLQGKNGYRVWEEMDEAVLKKDIEKGLQYKIVKNKEPVCIFSIQLDDSVIWRQRNRQDAISLHRIVTHPNFKGQKQFQAVLNWAKEFARQQHLKFVRMDTWADNEKIISYYKSFGFEFIENYKTPDTTELPVPNRNLNVAFIGTEIE